MPAEPRRDLPVPLPLTLVLGQGAGRAEYAVNLSPGGMCLHLRDAPPVGEAVGVRFELPTGGPAIETTARVVWVTREAERGSGTRFCEVGLRFEALPEGAQERIRHYVRQVLT